MTLEGNNRETNYVPLRDYVERLFDEKQVALEAAHRAQADSLRLATSNMERRLDALNELRQQVTEDRGQFITRDKYEADREAWQLWQARMDGALALLRLLAAGGGVALLLELARLAGLMALPHP